MLSSKEFNEKLQLKNFKELEEEFQKAKIFFENLNYPIKCDDIESKFPAFCLFNEEIRLKFPTYKIRIINSKMNHNDLQKLLGNAGNFLIYEEANVRLLHSLEPVQSTAIHCLESSLSENESTADKIEDILNKNRIRTERVVDSGHYRIPIKVDDKGYATVIKM